MHVCELDRRVAALRALADPLRLRLLAMLHDRGETCVCELLAELGTTQSNISMHVRVLRDAGLIRGERVGKWVFYAVDQARLTELLECLGAAFDPATAGVQRAADGLYACCREGEVPASRKAAAERRTCAPRVGQECAR